MKHHRLNSKHHYQFITDLYLTYRASLNDWLTNKFSNSNVDVEDIIQKTFTKLLEFENIKEINNYGAYLRTIASNYALMSIRSSNTIHNSNKLHLAVITESQQNITPEQIYNSKMHFNEVMHQLSTHLSDKQQEVIFLARVEGKTYTQIHEITGWSLSDICRQLKKADLTISMKLTDVS